MEVSAGKMSALWTGTPTTIRLDDLDVICEVLDCPPTELLLREPDKVAARRQQLTRAVGDHTGDLKDSSDGVPGAPPRLGRNRSMPPA